MQEPVKASPAWAPPLGFGLTGSDEAGSSVGVFKHSPQGLTERPGLRKLPKRPGRGADPREEMWVASGKVASRLGAWQL